MKRKRKNVMLDCHLGQIQMTILHILKEGQFDREYIYDEIRTTQYTWNVRKSQTRVSIKNAIKTLKERGLIDEHYGILSKL